MERALFIMDMQNICVGSEHHKMFTYDNAKLINNINQLINEYDAENVYYIKNIMKNTIVNKLAPFQAYDDTPETELVDGLKIVSNRIYKKYTGDAFSNTSLLQNIKENKITEIEIVGVDGGGCVSLTALGAVNAGYKVILNTYCIGTIMIKREQKYHHKLQKMGAVYL